MPAQSASWLLQVDHRCDSRDLLYFSRPLLPPPLRPIPSVCLFLFVFRSQSSGAIMNASIFHLASHPLSRLLPLARASEAVPIFSCNFFPSQPALSPFTRYRPRLLMARDCLSRLSSAGGARTARPYIHDDLCPPRDRCRRHAPSPS